MTWLSFLARFSLSGVLSLHMVEVTSLIIRCASTHLRALHSTSSSLLMLHPLNVLHDILILIKFRHLVLRRPTIVVVHGVLEMILSILVFQILKLLFRFWVSQCVACFEWTRLSLVFTTTWSDGFLSAKLTCFRKRTILFRFSTQTCRHWKYWMGVFLSFAWNALIKFRSSRSLVVSL